MSRSLFPAFLLALAFHSSLAWVDLDLLARPLPSRGLPRALTIDIVTPRPVKKPAVVTRPSIVAHEPVMKKAEKLIPPKTALKPKKLLKKVIPPRKKIQPKKRIPPENKIKPEKSVVPGKSIPAKEVKPTTKSSEKPETRDLFSARDLAERERPEVLPESYRGAPDMAEMAPALMAAHQAREGVEESAPSDVIPEVPLTYASPIYKSNRPPSYPRSAKKRGYQGTVLLEVLVKEDGTVGSVRLNRSSGYKSLDRAALKSVKRWLFYPGKRGEKAVEMWVKVPVRFQLK